MKPPANPRLVAARNALGLYSQEQFAERIGVDVRQVRRWESADPPWPRPYGRQRLEAFFGMPLDRLGFTPPWARGTPTDPEQAGIRIAARSVALLAHARRDLAESVLGDELPWLATLPEPQRIACVHELLDALATGPAAFREHLATWRAFAVRLHAHVLGDEFA
ncbi:helix-turn-helix domain-containing protein [Embleya sp. NPDC005575]|uniref:helix-turn-helix domain-containing protein n=1 Tax=Embleya sp. NPDC005575 TaxID=3156892 RepID=UPI0033A3DF32